jgi:hypothetical protein
LDWIPTGEHAGYFAGVGHGFWRERAIMLSQAVSIAERVRFPGSSGVERPVA